jgi:muramoyltetrapeptide carboxypeptidase
MQFVIPAPLSTGSRVWVVAPSGPFDRTLVLRGMEFLRERYEVRFEPSLLDCHEQFAGTDERRRAELQRALDDDGASAIIAARGGYGLTRILPELDFTRFQRSPKWIVGFSDVTALHLECTRLGIASLHAHNVAGLGREDSATRSAWLRALEAPTEARTHTGLSTLNPGRARGPLVGGNLTLLFTQAAAGRLALPRGAVLAIEDVTEQTYRIDRMLTALITSGALRELAGILVGSFSECPPGRFGASAEAVVLERLAPLGVPMVGGAPFGHEGPNEPLHLGMDVELEASRGAFTSPAPR